MPYFDPRTETMPRDNLEMLQLQKLRSLLSSIHGRNRFYTKKMRASGAGPEDIRSLGDHSRLPFTTKAELIQAQAEDPPFGTNATFPESAYIRIHQTSGTTGAPLRVYDTRESWHWFGWCWGHVLTAAGLGETDSIFLAFSFGPFIGFWAAAEGASQIGALMIPGGGRDSHQRLQAMRDASATALCCTPTYALRLAEVAREQNFDLRFVPLRAVVVAGEPGGNVPNTKARIEAAWGAKCFDHAGGSEVGAHSFECELQPGGIHPIESEFIIEVVNPDSGVPVEAGQIGELVITNLGRTGFPVIRYRTGDLIQIDRSPCACGRTFLFFRGGILGRVDDMVVIRGVNVFPSAIENLVRRFDSVVEFQVAVSRERGMLELEIEIELLDGSSSESVPVRLAEAIQYSLGLRPRIRIARSGSLPRFELKARRFRF